MTDSSNLEVRTSTTVERPKLFSLPAAALQLSVSKRTLYRLIEAGKIASVTIGQRRLVAADEIDRFVEALKDAS